MKTKQNEMKSEKNKVEPDKSRVRALARMIEYVPNGVLSKIILKKPTGDVTVSSFDVGEGLPESISRFDNFVQIIEGLAEVSINKNKYVLKQGEAIIIPANTKQCFHAKQQCKIISTVIKSGYED